MTTDVTFNTALEAQSRTQSSVVGLADDFASFLSLLTIQLQNQDPLEPMDSSEFTDQLVAFTGVEQQINTNQKLDDLVALGISDTFSASLNYVGLEANYLGSEFEFDGTRPVTINYSAPGSIQTTIRIEDEAGEVIFSQDVSNDEAVERFVWNGETDTGEPAGEGIYNVRIDALDSNQAGVQTSTVVSGIVDGLETQNGNLFLLVGERAVPISQVINVRNPAAAGLISDTIPPDDGPNDGSQGA